MAAPLMAQSDDVSVKVALDLLQQSQTQAAAGNLEAAAELAATAQALLRGDQNDAVDIERRHVIHGEKLHEVHEGHELRELRELREVQENKVLQEIIELESLPEGASIMIDADGNVTFGEAGGMHIIEMEGGCGDENCEGCEECDLGVEIECEVECEEGGDFEFIIKDMENMDAMKNVEMHVMRMDGSGGRFPGLPGGGLHVIQGGGPHAPHAMQGGGDVHMQLQAVQLELQALRLELQALRMQMGAMRGGMGGQMAPMQMKSGNVPLMKMRGMMAPHAQSFGGQEGIFLRELHGEHGHDGEHGEHDFDFDIDLEELHSLEDFDFDFDMEELHRELQEGFADGHADGAKVRTEIKLIHNGKTYEGEEARKMMKELGLGEMGGRMQMRVGPTPPTPPTPPKQRVRVRKAHDQEDL
jgi:hypothetical protein